MAASLAIHGAVLFAVHEDELPGTAGGEAAVEITLVSASRQQPQQSKQSLPSPRKQKQVGEMSVAEAERVPDHPVSLKAEMSGSDSEREQADIAGRESLVRKHLERFKYYPASARRRGIGGEVGVAFELDGRGLARSLKITSGSGYSLLDEAALETVHRAEPFPVDAGAYQFVLRFRSS